jgi:hypothetical protein
MKGSDFAKQMANVYDPQRSALALKAMLAGSMPDFWAQRYECKTEAVIDGKHYVCSYFTGPNYLCIGEDGDWLTWPLTVLDLQKFCDSVRVTSVSNPADSTPKFYIPTAKLVKNNWAFSQCKIEPQPLNPYPGLTTTSFVAEDEAIKRAMAAKGCAPTAFVRAKKAYNVAPGITNEEYKGKGVLHFTGWYRLDGSSIQGYDSTGKSSGEPWGHIAEFADYSHGCDVVYHDFTVNGVPYNFAALCMHPTLHVLVSDQGPFNPHYPNAGPNAPAVNAPSNALPPAPTAPANYKGDVFKTGMEGLPLLVKASTIRTGSQTGTPEGNGTSVANVLVGFAVALGGFFLIKRWSHAH